ncbi:MAG TPA: trehalose-phosphatase [Hyphomicrobiales bacterium]|nr:trehalose-phosphatase [Hyphomicrobiales bacterium]
MTGLPRPLDLARDALFLDVDGTLLDIAPGPDAVVVPEGLPATLVRLAERLGGALALLTGRDIATVDRLMAPARLAVAGLHGAELRLPDGTRQEADPPPELGPVRAALRAFVAARPGLLLEDKGAAVAVHFRAAPALEGEVAAEVRRLVAAAGPALALQAGKMVAEIRPAGGDKGSALESFLALPPFIGRRPVAIGDDWTDEAAFLAANQAGGRSLRVGRADRPTAATEIVASPAALRSWIAAIAG